MFDKPSLDIIFLGFNDPRRHIRGVENVISRLAESTSSRCYYIYRGDKTEVHRWGKIVAISVPMNYVKSFFVLNGIIRRISLYRSVVVHGHNYYLSAMYCGKNMVFTIYDGLTYVKSVQRSKLLAVFSLIELFIYWRATKIHSISVYTWSRARFFKLFVNKVSIIYCSDPHEPREETREVTKILAVARPYFLAVRSIEDRANIDLLLDFAELLGKSWPQTDIVVAGKGPLLTHYRNEATRRGLSNIQLRGYVSDDELDDLYRGAKCVLVPALYGEGFGLPIIEAYARGTPVAAADICAIPEVIFAPNHLFENSVTSLMRAIDAACGVPRADYVAYYRRRFAASLIKRQYADFYAGLELGPNLTKLQPR